MSLDELRADLKRNMAEAAKLTTFAEVRDHFVNTLWPYLEANLDVVEEMDDAVAELVDQTEDYLQAETAGVFAAVVQSSLLISAELRKRAAGDELLEKRIAAHEQLCQQALEMLGQITMIAPDDDGEDEDEDEDDEGEGSDA
jgi:hypothetical protein